MENKTGKLDTRTKMDWISTEKQKETDRNRDLELENQNED